MAQQFKDGDYDWQGGTPLSVTETITVTVASDKKLSYTLVGKETTLADDGQGQIVVTAYAFELSK